MKNALRLTMTAVALAWTAGCGGEPGGSPLSTAALHPSPHVTRVKIVNEGGTKVAQGLDPEGKEVSRLQIDAGQGRVVTTYRFVDRNGIERSLEQTEDVIARTISVRAQTSTGDVVLTGPDLLSAGSAEIGGRVPEFEGHVTVWSKVTASKPVYMQHAVNRTIDDGAEIPYEDTPCIVARNACDALTNPIAKTACAIAVDIACGGGPTQEEKQIGCNRACTSSGHAYGVYDPASGACVCSAMDPIPPGGCRRPKNCRINPYQCGCPYTGPVTDGDTGFYFGDDDIYDLFSGGGGIGGGGLGDGCSTDWFGDPFGREQFMPLCEVSY